MASRPRPPAAALVHVAFRHPDATHFVAVTASSFHVFYCEPDLRRVFSRPVGEGSGMITSVEMLTWSELAIVTRKPDAIKIWDEFRLWLGDGGTMKSACGVVRGVRLLGDYMLVAGEETTTVCVKGVHCYRWVKEVTTGPNPLGLCAVARPADGQATLLYALPRPEQCAVQLRRYGRAGSVNVHAHASGLACLALSSDGRLLATAGSRGSLVRVFSTTTGKLLQELRRGSSRADIHCIVFSPHSKWLAISSDKGTVHVFSVRAADMAAAWADVDTPVGDAGLLYVAPPSSPAPAAKARQQEGAGSSSSTFSFLKGYLPDYLSSEWSLAQLRGLRVGTQYKVAFGQQPYTVLVVGMDGSFQRCLFDPARGGEMLVQEHCNFMLQD